MFRRLSSAAQAERIPPHPIAIKLASFVGKSRGSRHKSEFINNLAFGNYNKKFDNVKTDFDWLTRDEAEVQKYIDDKYCGFLFTAAGYKDLFSVLNSVSGKDWYEQLSTDIPVLVVSGSMDPVGDYSKGVTQSPRISRLQATMSPSSSLTATDMRFSTRQTATRSRIISPRGLMRLSKTAQRKAE